MPYFRGCRRVGQHETSQAHEVRSHDQVLEHARRGAPPQSSTEKKSTDHLKTSMQTERVARKHNWELYNREDYIDKLMREDKRMTRKKANRAWEEKLADPSTYREMEEGQEVIAVRTRTSISHTQSIEARRQIAGEKALDGPDGLLARFFCEARLRGPPGWAAASGVAGGSRPSSGGALMTTTTTRTSTQRRPSLADRIGCLSHRGLLPAQAARNVRRARSAAPPPRQRRRRGRLQRATVENMAVIAWRSPRSRRS